MEMYCQGYEFCIHDNYITTLVSKGFPASYPSDAEEAWAFDIPPGETYVLLVNHLQIERPWDLVTVFHTTAHDSLNNTFSLVSGNVTSLILPEGHFKVRFCSDSIRQYGGFALLVLSYPQNMTYIGMNENEEFVCSSRMETVRLEARCDRAVDCHDFSDELDCPGECDSGGYSCRDSGICLRGEYQCDGWYDCPQRDDEENCDILKCPLGCMCGESPYYDRHGPRSPVCGRPSWQPFWVNCTDGWNQTYAVTAPKKSIIINLHHALVRDLTTDVFTGLENVHTLDLTSCQIRHLSSGVFNGLERLHKLIIANNSLTYLENGTFKGLHHLNLLYLEQNRISQLNEGCFRDLDSLWFLDLFQNRLTNLRPGTFKDLGNALERLVLEENLLTSVNRTWFEGIEDHLALLVIMNNPIDIIEPGTFSNLSSLKDLRIMARGSKPLRLYSNFFDGLSSLEDVHAYDPRLCCILPDHVECVKREPSHPLFTCRKTILQNTTIKVFIWVLSLSALVGNMFVVVSRLRTKSPTTVAAVQSVLITNLAVADFLMGVYMLIIAVMDFRLGESYFWDGIAAEWRSSYVCQAAGFISVLSSEASVFLITLISFDRLICILFPFSQRRLGVRSARIVVSCIWMLDFLVTGASILLNNLNPDAYSLSDVCVGLPLIRKYADLFSALDDSTLNQYGIQVFSVVSEASIVTWQYSIALFLGVNFASFFVIIVCYVAIFIKVRFSGVEVGRRNHSASEIRMALKMSVIVGTDFFCWIPIILLGILIQAANVTITPNVYAWLVVFVLPINSSLNPFLYTFMDRKKSIQEKK